MIKDVQQLKELILWAKSEKVKSFSIDGINVELSDMAFIPELSAFDVPAVDSVNTDGKQVIKRDLFESQSENAISDEDLYWSTNS